MAKYSWGVIVVVLIIATIIDRFIRHFLASSRLPLGSFFISPTAHLETSFAGCSLERCTFFLLLGMVAIVVVVVFFLIVELQKRGRPWIVVTLTAIAFGGLNNVMDRLMYGGVWDYWTIAMPFGMIHFNWSDIIIVASVFYLLYAFSIMDRGSEGY